MPIIQIPFQDPVAPPEKDQPEQLGLYDADDWQPEERDLAERVPHLVIQLQDDLQRSRKREALWLSIIVHLLLFIGLWHLDWIAQSVGWHIATAVPVDLSKQQSTFLALPSDLQKVPRRPNTNIASDKDRIAMSRHPQLDPKELRHILASPPPGAPGLRAPQAPPQNQIAQNQPLPNQPSQQEAQQTPRPQFQSNQPAQLQIPAKPNNSFSKYAGGMSAGSAIQQAEAAAAAHRGGGGDYGVGMGTSARAQGGLEIVSDTLGVDFGPYLKRVHDAVQMHWYDVLPESTLPPIYKKGKLMIQFSIQADGTVSDMHVVASSDDVALDRAAWAGITASSPLPPLPEAYTKQGGKELTLKGFFMYNLEEKDLQ